MFISSRTLASSTFLKVPKQGLSGKIERLEAHFPLTQTCAHTRTRALSVAAQQALDVLTSLTITQQDSKALWIGFNH